MSIREKNKVELENNDKMVEESKKVYEKFLFPFSSK